ncbi:polysaccharide pyruvyl transferase family protein [Dyella sp.]|jgi:colanic acid/amylovoran biosynthesis protein|uniref:polysaccharide pyruvyl transferase family protein n=1 Tax=Dyella sp. TaxID=1869338 RepID=UPI002D786F49|nr:polysaccharide pyruvyl transferase family protein [Dyella sp.]HET6431606.1 polysaccharide pyruvyl transferase family protein [Dyella sp.]
MKRFYLSGQYAFDNRGCEAIVRSTVDLLTEQFGEVEVLVPATNGQRDAVQWPQAASKGVRFVRAYQPLEGRYWVQLQRLPLPLLQGAPWPFPMPSWLRDDLDSVDAVLAVGGDNYSLDYRIPSPIMAVDRYAMDLGKPVILWGGSVGPFDRAPGLMRPMARHLSRMRHVAARESASYDYLTRKLGLANVIRMADPAFVLSPEPVAVDDFWPEGSGRVLGLNVSPLIERYRKPGQDLRAEVAGFIRHVVQDLGMRVLLVPHVNPLMAEGQGGDSRYMAPLLEQLGDLGGAVKLMPSHFNAAQTKHVISRLDFFMGARTHATIAALSSGVPTISIAYSVKARGINRDLFGSEDMVLQTPDVSATTLRSAMEWLMGQEQSMRETLADRLGEWRGMARTAAVRVSDALVH